MAAQRARSAPKTSACTSAGAGDEAVGRRVLLQVVQAAAAALRRHREGAVFDERAGIEQRRDVLARAAPALGAARGQHLRARRIVEQRAARGQLIEVGARRRAGGSRRRARRRIGHRSQVEQQVAFVDRIAALHVHGPHHAIGQRLDGELHLHRLEAQQHRAAADGGADAGFDSGDGALHAGTVVDDRLHGGGRAAALQRGLENGASHCARFVAMPGLRPCRVPSVSDGRPR